GVELPPPVGLVVADDRIQDVWALLDLNDVGLDADLLPHGLEQLVLLAPSGRVDDAELERDLALRALVVSHQSPGLGLVEARVAGRTEVRRPLGEGAVGRLGEPVAERIDVLLPVRGVGEGLAYPDVV